MSGGIIFDPVVLPQIIVPGINEMGQNELDCEGETIEFQTPDETAAELRLARRTIATDDPGVRLDVHHHRR